MEGGRGRGGGPQRQRQRHGAGPTPTSQYGQAGASGQNAGAPSLPNPPTLQLIPALALSLPICSLTARPPPPFFLRRLLPSLLVQANYSINHPDGYAFVVEALNLVKNAAKENRKLFYKGGKSNAIGDVAGWERIASQLSRNNGVTCNGLHLRHVLWVGNAKVDGLMRVRRSSGAFQTTHVRGESGTTDGRTHIEMLLDECLELENSAISDMNDDNEDRGDRETARMEAEASVDAAFAGRAGRRGRNQAASQPTGGACSGSGSGSGAGAGLGSGGLGSGGRGGGREDGGGGGLGSGGRGGGREDGGNCRPPAPGFGGGGTPGGAPQTSRKNRRDLHVSGNGKERKISTIECSKRPMGRMRTPPPRQARPGELPVVSHASARITASTPPSHSTTSAACAPSAAAATTALFSIR